ncbi:hypothetical protein QBC45DRAFT_446111 [Copromyces sp. CBS 386.78]|nr:hypothetical protein QBC45DRAFT_446111 [Copromyces sp. CBS 386.78]
MRFQTTLGLFLSFCLPSMGHIAKSPPNSLQSRAGDHDQQQHPSVDKRADWNDFGATCKHYRFENRKGKCELTADCLPKGKADNDKNRVRSKLDINKCLAHFVMTGSQNVFFDWKAQEGIDSQVKLDEPVGNICSDSGPCHMNFLHDGGYPELECEHNAPLSLGYGVKRNDDGHLVCAEKH